MYSPLVFSKLYNSVAISSVRTIQRRLLAATSASPKQSLFEQKPTSEKDELKNKKWQLIVSVCLERFSIISPEPTELEVKYYEMLRMIEDEKSLLNFHELRHEEDVRTAKEAKHSKFLLQSDERQIVTARDLEDAWTKERSHFIPASRKTDADDANVQSLSRLLDRKLIFLAHAGGGKGSWGLPETLLREGETLAQAAQRCLDEHLDISPSATFYGNAPRKLYKYKYPKPLVDKTGAIGAKIFIFKSELAQNAKVTSRVEKFRWLCRDELINAIDHRRYRSCVASFIFE